MGKPSCSLWGGGGAGATFVGIGRQFRQLSHMAQSSLAQTTRHFMGTGSEGGPRAASPYRLGPAF